MSLCPNSTSLQSAVRSLPAKTRPRLICEVIGLSMMVLSGDVRARISRTDINLGQKIGETKMHPRLFVELIICPEIFEPLQRSG